MGALTLLCQHVICSHLEIGQNVRVDGRVRLVQQPIAELQRLRTDLLYIATTLSVPADMQSTEPLISKEGALELEMQLKLGVRLLAELPHSV